MSRPITITPKEARRIAKEIETNLLSGKYSDGKISFTKSLSNEKNKSAHVYFTKNAWYKILALVDACPKEVGWHCTAERVVTAGKSTFRVNDVFVFPQHVTGVTVTPDVAEYTDWLGTLDDETYNNLKFHGHSHVNMGVSPSGTDTTYQDNLIQNLKSFYIFAIFNKSGKIWMNIYDVENNIIYEDKDINYHTPEPDESKWATDTIKKYVKDEVKSSYVHTANGGVWKQQSLNTPQYGIGQPEARSISAQEHAKSVVDDAVKDIEKYQEEATSWEQYRKNLAEQYGYDYYGGRY